MAREFLVDRSELTVEAHARADRVGFADHVVAEHARTAAVWPQQRREHAHGGGLSSPVRAEQPEHAAARHDEVDAVHGAHFSEQLHQGAGFDRGFHAGSFWVRFRDDERGHFVSTPA